MKQRQGVTLGKAVILWVIMASVSGCASFSGDFCDIYQPVKTNDATPESVQNEIDFNNVVYMDSCL